MIDELRKQAEDLGIKVDGRWKESKLLQMIADASDTAITVPTGITESPPKASKIFYGDEQVIVTVDNDRIEAMNALALRIWNGQSPDMPRHERIERIHIGLERQGYGNLLEHLSLPNA